MDRFELNPDFDRQLYAIPELREMVAEAGDRVLDEAIRIAQSESETGDFASSLEKKDHRGDRGRPIATVYSDDPGALSIEFGTVDTPAHRVLGRALDVLRR